MKHLGLVLLFLLFTAHLIAGIGNPLLGGRSAGLAHASVTLSDLWSVSNNQAGLAWVEKTAFGAYYENRFGLEDLALKGAAVAIPLGSGGIGLSVQQFGASFYNETKYGLGYGQQLGEHFSLGVQLNYLRIFFAENYGSKGILNAEIGLMADVTEKLKIGAHLFNPTTAELADFDNERVPTIFRLGAQYAFSDDLFIVSEVEKDVDFPGSVKVGVEYQAIKNLFLRAGVSTNPFRNSFGFGYQWKGVQLDVAASYHEVLGYSPQVSFGYIF